MYPRVHLKCRVLEYNKQFTFLQYIDELIIL